MSESSIVPPRFEVGTRDRVRTVFAQTMGYVAGTAALFALGAYLGRDLSGGAGIIAFLAALACLIGMCFAVRRSLPADDRAAGRLRAADRAGHGADAGVLRECRSAGGVAFGRGDRAVHRGFRRGRLRDAAGSDGDREGPHLGAGRPDRVRRRADLRELPGGALIYSILGLVIFAGLVMVDFQRLRRSVDVDSAPFLAASIFLDIVNVFLFFLQIFSGQRQD